MARYRVLQKSFINNRIVEEGEVVEYDGEPGENLELVKGKKGTAPNEEGGDGESNGQG